MFDDSKLWPHGCPRCGLTQFGGWLTPWALLLVWALVSVFFVLFYGLNVTGMDDYFAFGLWIVVDLGVIALGAGAFFTGFLNYVIGKKELTNIINAAVIIGFICYSGAVAMLGIDIGQPARGWFIFWHANVHSMLTEVSFCITTYLIVLTVEFVPLILENRRINKVPDLSVMAHHMHRIMIVFAATGTFLSFFHQGSLGGMPGVLYARPFAFREGFMIWPWTFFLFILSAIAAGPSFTTLCVMLAEKVSGRKLVKHKVKMLMGKICGRLLLLYLVLKGADTLYWMFVQLPSMGLTVGDMYKGSLGYWLLFAELGAGLVLPCIMLNMKIVRENYALLALAMLLNCFGAVMNRFVMIIQALAIPVLPFEKYLFYSATWQEWGITFGVIAYGFIVFSLAYRYLPVFPQERELNKA
jgi:Ni/Fe-hydrogenase subunit HybB-like protein